MRATRAMTALAMLALGGALMASTPSGADITGPDDPKIPPCADFANMTKGSYTTAHGKPYEVTGQPGTATNPATWSFTAKVWSDVNADVDKSGNPACGDVTYTVYLYAMNPDNTAGQLIATPSFKSNQGTSSQTSFDFSVSFCPTSPLQSCTTQGPAPTTLGFYVTTELTKRGGKTVLLDQAPEPTASGAAYTLINIDEGPGGTFH